MDTLCRDSGGSALARHNSTPCVDLKGLSPASSSARTPFPTVPTASKSLTDRTHWHVSASRLANTPPEVRGELSRNFRKRLRRNRRIVSISPASSCRENTYGGQKTSRRVMSNRLDPSSILIQRQPLSIHRNPQLRIIHSNDAIETQQNSVGKAFSIKHL